MSSKAPRVLVVDDEVRVRHAIKNLLERAGLQVRAVGTIDHGLEFMAAERVDLILLDLYLADGSSGLDLLRQIAPDELVPVLVFTGVPSVESAVESIQLSAIDYLTKPVDNLVERVTAALERSLELQQSRRRQDTISQWAEWIRANDTSLRRSPGAAVQPARTAIDPKALGTLTRRERDVLGLIRCGHRTRDVASSLQISPHTVRNHLKSIMSKLGVHSQLELVARLGTLSTPEGSSQVAQAGPEEKGAQG